jgi:hypothetical protein
MHVLHEALMHRVLQLVMHGRGLESGNGMTVLSAFEAHYLEPLTGKFVGEHRAGPAHADTNYVYFF